MFAPPRQPLVIFIDKFNISGIEMMILEQPVQEIASWTGNLLARLASAKDHCDFHCRGRAATW
jgi:hypothetical protein